MSDATADRAPDAKPAKRKLSRRGFILRSLAGGTGVMLGVGYLGRNSIRREIYALMDTVEPSYLGDASDPTMWFEITEDERIRLFSPKVEMGQGSFTSFAQMAADELEVELDRVEVVHAATATGVVDGMSTGGSLSVAGLWMPLRTLAATLRATLVAEAARTAPLINSGAAPDSIEAVVNGVVSYAQSGVSKTYGELAASLSARGAWELAETPPLKPISDCRFIGKPIPRVDLQAKVFGEPIFGMDASAEGMLHGSIVRSERIGATLVSADTSAAEGMPGVVKVVREDDFVGVVAETRMQAEAAKRAITAEWRTERDWESADIEAMIRVGEGTPMVIQREGDAKGALEGGDVVRAEFTSPIGAHAQLEPNGALAHVEERGATVTMSTQVPGVTRDEVAERLGLEPEAVNLVPTYLGGGFGRRLHTPNAIQAAILSRAAGKPVKCFFTRKEEFQHDTFRPPTHHIMQARLASDGRIQAMKHEFSSGDVAYGSAILPDAMNQVLGTDVGAFRGGFIQYGRIPHHEAVSWHVKLPFATSWWRSLGLLANTFAIESFMDELAEKAGQDPVAFRLAHLADDPAGQRLKRVIEAAVDKAGYRDEARAGRAMGFACSTDGGTPAAAVVDLSMVDGQPKVHDVFLAMDPGFAVNPDQVRAQCEGAVCMGISASLYERMEVRGGSLRPVIYGPYRMALLRDAPRRVEVELIDGTGEPGPVGEPPLGPLGAALANAIYRLTGERRRSLPLV
ncbi:MAG: molybdopterin cofactor-binding domain-containing protein [Myxococcota bacterium]